MKEDALSFVLVLTFLALLGMIVRGIETHSSEGTRTVVDVDMGVVATEYMVQEADPNTGEVVERRCVTVLGSMAAFSGAPGSTHCSPLEEGDVLP